MALILAPFGADELVQGEPEVEHQGHDVQQGRQERVPRQGYLLAGEDQEEVQEHRGQHEAREGSQVLGDDGPEEIAGLLQVRHEVEGEQHAQEEKEAGRPFVAAAQVHGEPDDQVDQGQYHVDGIVPDVHTGRGQGDLDHGHTAGRRG